MKFISVILFLFIWGHACNSQPGNQSKTELIACEDDTLRVENKLMQFTPDRKLPTGELLIKIGKTFLGTPYVSYTLENGEAERLVVNLRELDCTTFDETCLALARTIKSGKTDFGSYANELERIRYRGGHRDGYLSRLHYFSDWLLDNAQKGIISPLDNTFQEPWQKTINFMSTHPDSYQLLKNNPEMIREIAAHEQRISSSNHFYIPKEELETKEKFLKNGDLIGITTSIAGLDIAHVGFVVWVDGRVHMLHASSVLEKVVISDVPLSDYLATKKSFTGIMLARAN
ncbi:N-acetylmuramoyl-L-alanine amidase-like domain-containing protein [Mangrovibacterium sp.]|uniref:N-acetylmuramoyl-L-alanine amidase-like domain-containing protein n=1 Tax=Mangrovibacterium sp. TaxID=1961364 RepID=UPI0035645272